MRKSKTMEVEITSSTNMMFYNVGDKYIVEKNPYKWECYRVANEKELTLIAINHCKIISK